MPRGVCAPTSAPATGLQRAFVPVGTRKGRSQDYNSSLNPRRRKQWLAGERNPTSGTAEMFGSGKMDVLGTNDDQVLDVIENEVEIPEQNQESNCGPAPSVRDFVHRELSHGGCGRQSRLGGRPLCFRTRSPRPRASAGMPASGS